MPIPAQVFYNLLGLLGFVSVLAFIFSWSAARGVTIQSCKGDGTCGCDGKKHKDGTTAERILALIKE